MIAGAIAMIVFVFVSIYILVIARKVYGIFKTIKSWYETVQQLASVPVMLITAFLAKQWLNDDSDKKHPEKT